MSQRKVSMKNHTKVRLLLLAAVGFCGLVGRSGAQDLQVRYASGQNVAPAFEGWEANPDGTFDLVFGYFSRNWEEQVDAPVGPLNAIEPGGPDRGQPTHFFPRRNRFVFKVHVPKDFGKSELVWTLTINGKTEKAYGSLLAGYALDDGIVHRNITNTTPPGIHENLAPVVDVDGRPQRTIKVGEHLKLRARVTDDGRLIPRPAPRVSPVGEPGYTPAWGLRVSWFLYRGPSTGVTFTPEQIKVYPDYQSNSPWTPGWAPPKPPADGIYETDVTFRVPGIYVLRLLAHDGGLGTWRDVTVTVFDSKP